MSGVILTLVISARFNPHPTRRLGAIARIGIPDTRAKRFNPHPTRRLGAIIALNEGVLVWQVSILTQPEGWVP